MAAPHFAATAMAQDKKPNILFIMGDDIGWMQLVSYQQGLGLGETPNLDRIANDGAPERGQRISRVHIVASKRSPIASKPAPTLRQSVAPENMHSPNVPLAAAAMAKAPDIRSGDLNRRQMRRIFAALVMTTVASMSVYIGRRGLRPET